MQNTETLSEAKAQGFIAKLPAFFQLTKPRIALMLVLTSAAGFYLGSPRFDLPLFLNSMIAITLLAFGVAALNQYLERDLDGLMERTMGRPLPIGKILGSEALIFGVLLCLAAELYLALGVNLLTAFLGLIVVIGYVLLYTPLKTRTSLSTAIGALPGAMPPLMGFTSSSNEISISAWSAFAILFLWQFPHFLAIAWMYRDQYAKAGILMLPVVEKEGRITSRQMVAFSFLTLGMSVVPYFIGLAGLIYLSGAILLGAWFCWECLKFARSKSDQQARRILRVSVIYLPLIFLLLVLNH